jgi:hypothetical protein
VWFYSKGKSKPYRKHLPNLIWAKNNLRTKSMFHKAQNGNCTRVEMVL